MRLVRNALGVGASLRRASLPSSSLHDNRHQLRFKWSQCLEHRDPTCRRCHPPHVLVVDDDPDIRAMLEDYLAKNDMRVTALASGREMLAVFETEAIDLVLLDVRMPGENGMLLAQALRERASVPIVLLTGNAEEADRVMGLELGADDYVTKPFSPRELLARLRAVLRRYQALRVCRRATTSAGPIASPAGSSTCVPASSRRRTAASSI